MQTHKTQQWFGTWQTADSSQDLKLSEFLHYLAQRESKPHHLCNSRDQLQNTAHAGKAHKGSDSSEAMKLSPPDCFPGVCMLRYGVGLVRDDGCSWAKTAKMA